MQDVSCGIGIPIGYVATERTHVSTHTEGLLHILPTLRTLLRGVVRCNSNDLAVSTFSLTLQVVPEYPPGCIGNGKGQTMVFDHVSRFQIFNDDDLIVLDVLVRRFMEGVFALVVNALM